MRDYLKEMLYALTSAYSRRDYDNHQLGLPPETNIGKLFSIFAWGLDMVNEQADRIKLWDNLDHAHGAVLDRYGANFGVQRFGESDAFYRLAIKVKVQSQLSGGDIDTVLNAAASLFDIPVEKVFLTERFPGKIKLDINESDLDAEIFSTAAGIMETIKRIIAAGVGVLLTLHIVPIIIEEHPENFFFKDFHVWLRANNYDCIFLNGDHRLDGIWLLDQSAGRLWLVRTGIRAGVHHTYRVEISRLWAAGGIGVRTAERIPLHLSAAVYTVDNMGCFVRLNGKEDLDGSWLLGQLPRAPVFMDFRTGLWVLEPEERIRYGAAGIRAIQRTEGGRVHPSSLAASLYLIGPTRDQLSGTLSPRTAIWEKDDFYLRRLTLAADWKTVNRVAIPPPELSPCRWENWQTLRVRGLRLNESACEPSGAARIRIGAGAFGVRDAAGGLRQMRLGVRKLERFDGVRTMNGTSKFNGGSVIESQIT